MSRQQQSILDALRRAGAAGCTSRDLNAICFRYGGRIMELRAMGHDIKTERIEDGLFRYTLTERSSDNNLPPRENNLPAKDLLLNLPSVQARGRLSGYGVP